jgi:hypothetical protein
MANGDIFTTPLKPFEVDQPDFTPFLQIMENKRREELARLDQAEALRRDQLKALYGYDISKLATALRPLFQQDVEKASQDLKNTTSYEEGLKILGGLTSEYMEFFNHSNENVINQREMNKKVSMANDARKKQIGKEYFGAGFTVADNMQTYADAYRYHDQGFIDYQTAEKGSDGKWYAYELDRQGNRIGTQRVPVTAASGYANSSIFDITPKFLGAGNLRDFATDSVAKEFTLNQSIVYNAKKTKEGKREGYTQNYNSHIVGTQEKDALLRAAVWDELENAGFIGEDPTAKQLWSIQGVAGLKQHGYTDDQIAQVVDNGRDRFLDYSLVEYTGPVRSTSKPSAPTDKQRELQAFLDTVQAFNVNQPLQVTGQALTQAQFPYEGSSSEVIKAAISNLNINQAEFEARVKIPTAGLIDKIPVQVGGRQYNIKDFDVFVQDGVIVGMKVNQGFETKVVQTPNKEGDLVKQIVQSDIKNNIDNPGVEGLDTSSIITGNELLEVLGQINSAFSQRLNASLNDIVGFKLGTGSVAISPNIQILSTEDADPFQQGPVDPLDDAMRGVLNPNN